MQKKIMVSGMVLASTLIVGCFNNQDSGKLKELEQTIGKLSGDLIQLNKTKELIISENNTLKKALEELKIEKEKQELDIPLVPNLPDTPPYIEDLTTPESPSRENEEIEETVFEDFDLPPEMIEETKEALLKMLPEGTKLIEPRTDLENVFTVFPDWMSELGLVWPTELEQNKAFSSVDNTLGKESLWVIFSGKEGKVKQIMEEMVEKVGAQEVLMNFEGNKSGLKHFSNIIEDGSVAGNLSVSLFLTAKGELSISVSHIEKSSVKSPDRSKLEMLNLKKKREDFVFKEGEILVEGVPAESLPAWAKSLGLYFPEGLELKKEGSQVMTKATSGMDGLSFIFTGKYENSKKSFDKLVKDLGLVQDDKAVLLGDLSKEFHYVNFDNHEYMIYVNLFEDGMLFMGAMEVENLDLVNKK